jgi:hypothetical protein
MALLCLALFWNLSGKSYVQQMSLAGFLFFTVINQTMMNLMGVLLIFQEERPVFLREQANQMYRVTPYYLSKIIAEFPI